MNPTDYAKNVLVTESTDLTPIYGRVNSDRTIRLLHATLGWASELSELVDAVNSTNIDWVNVSEEISDQAWYTSLCASVMGFDHEDISGHEHKAAESGLRIKNTRDIQSTVFAITWAAGEFSDLVKKYIFYGKELNEQKAKEILQSMCLSMAGAAFVCGTTMEQCRATNIAKLKARYGDKFTEAAALNRNLEVERQILEEGIKHES